MFLKTTSPQFIKYGSVTDQKSKYPVVKVNLEDNTLRTLRSYDHPTMISILEGIGIIVIQEIDGSLEQFVVHRSPIINANTLFTVIPITNTILVEVSHQTNDINMIEEKEIDAKLVSQFKPVRPSFDVTNIYSYYYNVKGKGYSFSGEEHHFWELTYVDTGELEVEVDNEVYTLEAQDIMIFFPGQFHKQRIKGDKSSSYLTIMFDMNIDWKRLIPIKNKVITSDNTIYTLIDKFIQETILFEEHNDAFSRDLILTTLKEIIINLVQQDDKKDETQEIINPIQSQFENELLREIDSYIHLNIYEPLSIEDLCEHFSISRSTLQSIFKKHVNVPPKRYINDLKMVHAQRLILEGKHSITEIAMNLGFSSIHYFSRKFKANFGMSPTEYLQSIYKYNPDSPNTKHS